jgi:predicted nucleotidyltransferase
MTGKILHKDQIFEQLRLHKDVLQDFGVQEIGLFGSYVKNKATENSDIDLLIDLRKGQKSLFNVIRLGDYLESILEKKVDIVTPQGLSKHIGKHILAEVERIPL